MKVIGIVGSPRRNGNTELLTKHTLKAISEEGVDTEFIRLAGLEIKPCTACMACKEQEVCSIKDDLFPIYLRMKEADGIILASPVYYSSATALITSRPWCERNFKDAIKEYGEEIEVYDIAEIAFHAL